MRSIRIARIGLFPALDAIYSHSCRWLPVVGPAAGPIRAFVLFAFPHTRGGSANDAQAHHYVLFEKNAHLRTTLLFAHYAHDSTRFAQCACDSRAAHEIRIIRKMRIYSSTKNNSHVYKFGKMQYM